MVREGSRAAAVFPLSSLPVPARRRRVMLCGTGLSTTEPAAMRRTVTDLDVPRIFAPAHDPSRPCRSWGVGRHFSLPVQPKRFTPGSRETSSRSPLFADHEPGCMVEEDAAPDPGVGMDVGLECRRGAALQIERESLRCGVHSQWARAMGLDCHGSP